MKCCVENCNNKAVVKVSQLCQKHYVRNKKYGNFEGKRPQESLFVRFWKRVDIKDNDSCWHWLGEIGFNGYGRISLGKRNMNSEGAHRISWILHNKKDIPKGMHIMHSCDNPICVNPNHLSIGTPKENSDDMIRKGRKVIVAPVGNENGKAIINETIVREIRSSNLSHAELARIYNVSSGCIRGVRIGRTWSHVK